ncbi:hypothetical protein [Phenylobacterium sp.]|uniref:hypothetical protein n=1 Tax=Phenylobacterium sp. TaxID=1871053 RepID=UPI001223BA95|nr:hypothetical protein [Phenylobacterium sp.]THD60521.1 MAG: hypothetical protein E8A49_13900 [Phenylobacterium sp.]
MGGFSGGQAIGSGFGLIRRHPAAIAVWAVFYLIVGVGPALLLQAGMWSHLPYAPGGDPSAALAQLSHMAGWFPLIWVLSLFHAAVAYSAVYRAVLDPEDRRYFYLRLGRRELSVGLTVLALLVVFLVGMIVAAIALFVVVRFAPGVVAFLATVGAMVGLVWLALRFSMAGPMAYAEQRFVFAESWTLTSGQGWKLFGVALCLMLIMIGLEFAILIPTVLALSLSGALGSMMAAAQAGHGPSSSPATIAAYAVILPILGALVVAIFGAPWASIYQQLSAGRTASPYEEA